eukprot:6180987-Pleurochrysis_carterae.AAC.1
MSLIINIICSSPAEKLRECAGTMSRTRTFTPIYKFKTASGSAQRTARMSLNLFTKDGTGNVLFRWATAMHWRLITHCSLWSIPCTVFSEYLPVQDTSVLLPPRAEFYPPNARDGGAPPPRPPDDPEGAVDSGERGGRAVCSGIRSSFSQVLICLYACCVQVARLAHLFYGALRRLAYVALL